MASARGCWLRDQMAVRFGAWVVTAVGSAPAAGTWACSVVVLLVGVEVEVEVELAAASRWRAETAKARAARGWRGSAEAATRRREAYMFGGAGVVVVWWVLVVVVVTSGLGGWRRASIQWMLGQSEGRIGSLLELSPG